MSVHPTLYVWQTNGWCVQITRATISFVRRALVTTFREASSRVHVSLLLTVWKWKDRKPIPPRFLKVTGRAFFTCWSSSVMAPAGLSAMLLLDLRVEPCFRNALF